MTCIGFGPVALVRVQLYFREPLHVYSEETEVSVHRSDIISSAAYSLQFLSGENKVTTCCWGHLSLY